MSNIQQIKSENRLKREKFTKSTFIELTPRSISQTSFHQLLQAQIPKAQKDTCELFVFFTLLGSAHSEVSCKHVGK